MIAVDNPACLRRTLREDESFSKLGVPTHALATCPELKAAELREIPIQLLLLSDSMSGDETKSQKRG
jgi:hypothetical protein